MTQSECNMNAFSAFSDTSDFKNVYARLDPQDLLCLFRSATCGVSGVMRHVKWLTLTLNDLPKPTLSPTPVQVIPSIVTRMPEDAHLRVVLNHGPSARFPTASAHRIRSLQITMSDEEQAIPTLRYHQ
jgi:hypothetical protein